MNFLQVVKRDLRFYRRTNLVMALLAAVCCAILTGAMLVGDSVQHTLRQIAQMRLGQRTRYAMSTGDRLFRLTLAEKFSGDAETNIAGVPVLAVKGILETPDGSIRVNNLNVYGIDSWFWQLAASTEQAFMPVQGVNISESVKARLGGTNGGFLLRVQKSTVLSRDLIFSTEGGDSQAWEIKIADVIPDEAMGRFSLQASQEPPLNVFVPIDWLAEKIGQPKKANLLLVADGWSSQDDLNSRLNECVILADLGLELRSLESENVLELRTSRIFLDKPIAEAALKTGDNPYGVFTYFVNEIRSGKKAVPYSTVSAVGHDLLADLAVDEIIINEWLADELDADEGDAIQLTYFQITPTRKLIEQTSGFTVKRVVPMMGSFADPTLMPDYPGLTEANSCGDWDSGIPINLKKIRDKDEDYWDTYKGTPKAFVSMEAAQTIWSNRFGTLTAVRWPGTENDTKTIAAELMKNLDPAQVGFAFKDVREAARRSASGSTDFAGLFSGLSMFLIFSAAVLLALMFVFYVESRTQQTGLLLAVGWDSWKVFSLFLAEGAGIALTGCVAGAVVSVLYTASLILILNATFWANAIAGLQLTFHMNPLTLIKGIAVSFVICIFAIQIALFHRLRRPVHQLLTGISEQYSKIGKSRGSLLSLLGFACFGMGVFISATSEVGQGQVKLFFIAGTLCLAGLILMAAGWLKWLRLKSRSFVNSLNVLAVKSIPRRTGRSITVLIALACGVFMVIGVGANYKDIAADAHQRRSGTGGFTLFAQTSFPVTEPLQLEPDPENTVPGIEEYDFIPMRLYQQDDASCLNLNRAAQPSLLGVRADDLAQRDAFSFQQTDSQDDISGWKLLDVPLDNDTIPAIGDYGTVFWALGKKLGDRIPCRTEQGGTINLKIVGILKDSLLQGRLFISEDNFVRCFPSIDGHQQFLIDADRDQHPLQAKALMKKYRDVGAEVVPARQKLAQFHEVENTYLAIFLVLGGLGVVLGSAALGLVLVLNVLDRRGELAMMQAVGFRKPALRKMLFLEHGLLLLAGLFCGAIPALWAVFPSVVTRGGGFPFVPIGLIVIAIFAGGALWIRFAAARILKTDFMNILRNE
ncbi:MAG: FtsX-like permease family protein [Planctomycetota bacterium]